MEQRIHETPMIGFEEDSYYDERHNIIMASEPDLINISLAFGKHARAGLVQVIIIIISIK